MREEGGRERGKRVRERKKEEGERERDRERSGDGGMRVCGGCVSFSIIMNIMYTWGVWW